MSPNDTENLNNEILTDQEILETLKEAHKTISAQKDDILKRKICQNIEHKLESLKADKDSSEILPERILKKLKI